LSRGSGHIKADIQIDKKHPRDLKWRFDEDFLNLIKTAIEAFE
jgi:hypothetical protein